MTTYLKAKNVVDYDVELERNFSNGTPSTVDGVLIRDDEFVLRRRIGTPFCSRFFDPLPNSLVGSEIFVTEKGESFFFKRKEKPIYYIDHSIGYKDSDPISLDFFDSSLTGSNISWEYNVFNFLDFFDVPICHDNNYNPCCLDRYSPGISEGFDLKQYVREVGGVNIGESGEALKSTYEFEFKIPYVYIEQGSSFESFDELVYEIGIFNFFEKGIEEPYMSIVEEYLSSYIVRTGDGGYFADRTSVFFDKDTFGRIPMKKPWENEGYLYNLCYLIIDLQWYVGEFTITCEESEKTEKYKTDSNSHLNFVGKDRTIHEIKGNYEDISVSYRRGACFATDGSSIDIYIGNEQKGHVEGNGQTVIKDGVGEETNIGEITSVFACDPSTSQEDIVGYFVGDMNGEKTLYSVSNGNVYVVFSERGQEEKIELFQKFYDDAFHGVLVTSKGNLKNIYEVKGKKSLVFLFSKEDFETGGWIRYEFLSENFIKEKNELSQVEYFLPDEWVGRKSVVSLFGYDGELKDEKEFENITVPSYAIVCGEMKNGTVYIGDVNYGTASSIYIIEKGSDTLKDVEVGDNGYFGFFHDDIDGKLFLAGLDEENEEWLFSVNIENDELEKEVRLSSNTQSYGISREFYCRSRMFFGKGNGVGFSVGTGVSINDECLGAVVPIDRSTNGGFNDEFIKMMGILRPTIYASRTRQNDFPRPVVNSVEVVDGIAYETYRIDMKLSNQNFYQYDHDMKQGNVPVIGNGEFP